MNRVLLTTLLFAVAAFLTAIVQAGETNAWKLYVKAIENASTAPNYVLITVVNTNTGSNRVICTEAPFLLGAIRLYGAYRDAIAHVMLERGLLPRRGCVVGVLTVDE